MAKDNIILVFAVIVIVFSIVASIFLDQGELVLSAVTISTAIVGACGIYIQMSKNKKINQASFTTTFSYQFYDQKELKKVMSKLERYRKGQKNVFTDKDYDNIVAYLQWCEELASLINKKVVAYDTIDDLFSYRFFLITNNEYVQKIELVPEKEFYHGVYIAHKGWENYKRKNNLPILMEDTMLDTSFFCQ
ncbi:MAG: hypothetical protein FWC00_03835 [Firmicutes bacterium]|nr:hypothetical protein [Bacillota bacterium]